MMRSITTTEDIKRLGTILSIWAHPDDESYLAAGVLAAAVQNGQDVVCVTATKGEAGSQNPHKWPPAILGEVRTKELEEALRILGVTKHHWLNSRDGHCKNVPLNSIVGKLQTIIQKSYPDAILTFGPDGWTGHEDHKTVHRWVKAAVEGLATPIPIYCVVHTPEHYQQYLRQADEALNFFFNIDRPPLIQAEKCDIYYELPPDICAKKCNALAASPSQTEVLFKTFSRDFVREAFSVECFQKVI